MNTLTVEVYRADRRCKSGERRVKTKDHVYARDAEALARLYRETYPPAEGYRIAVYETYLRRRNAQTGREFWERYDTPYSCSPSSEAYWST